MEEYQNLLLSSALALSVFIVIFAAWMVFRGVLTEAFENYRQLYRRTFVLELQFNPNSRLVVGGYIGGTVALFGLAAIFYPFISPFVLGFAYFLPQAVYSIQKLERRKRVDDVLPNVLQQLSANTKNVDSISIALQEVAQTAPKPMDYEIELISRQEQELKSFSKALTIARSRLNSKWFDIVTAVLQTAEEKGGQTSESLANLSRVFVQLKTMQNRINTATSQGRTSMYVMLAMPFVVIGIVYAVDPELVMLAVSNTPGIMVLCAAVFFYFLALGLAIWLSSVKI
ncbi:MAG: type II secretion system F family protein [Paracoccaceae bacterium]